LYPAPILATPTSAGYGLQKLLMYIIFIKSTESKQNFDIFNREVKMMLHHEGHEERKGCSSYW
jgi:hypothetical protein